MVLVIDNYDSFTYNLVQYLGELGAELRVRRNDEVTLDEIEAMAPEQIVISPGPGGPRTPASRSMSSGGSVRRRRCSACASAIRRSAWSTAASSAARTAPMHGKTSTVVHDGKGVFAGIAAPFSGGPLPLARHLERQRARRARSRGAHEGRRHHHGRASPELSGARRAVPPRVGADRRGPPHPAAISWSCDVHARCSKRSCATRTSPKTRPPARCAR